MSTPVGRPRPLREAARLWSLIIGAVGGVLAALVTGGVISTQQASLFESAFTSVDLLICAVVGVIAAGTGIGAAFSTAATGEADVTPLSAPMNNHGQRLVPENTPVAPVDPDTTGPVRRGF